MKLIKSKVARCRLGCKASITLSSRKPSYEDWPGLSWFAWSPPPPHLGSQATALPLLLHPRPLAPTAMFHCTQNCPEFRNPYLHCSLDSAPALACGTLSLSATKKDINLYITIIDKTTIRGVWGQKCKNQGNNIFCLKGLGRKSCGWESFSKAYSLKTSLPVSIQYNKLSR